MQIWVYGNSFESYLVAIVVPKQPALVRWAHENGVDGDFDALCDNAKVKEYALSEFSKTAKLNHVSNQFFFIFNFCYNLSGSKFPSPTVLPYSSCS